MPKQTILVIDDEKDVVKLLRYNLEKEGYQVHSAETGELGFELAKTVHPQVIVMDLMLPQIDGLEVCRMLKQNRQTRTIPVLMLTAKGTEADQIVGLESGASDYVTKPFSIKVFLARLKNVIKNKPMLKDEAPVYVCCELQLDKERHVFSLKGKTVSLTKMEFDILSVLMERTPGMVSRQQLVAAVWGQTAIVSPVAVNMQIRSLRMKLGKYRRYLETVRGAGYRLCSG